MIQYRIFLEKCHTVLIPSLVFHCTMKNFICPEHENCSISCLKFYLKFWQNKTLPSRANETGWYYLKTSPIETSSLLSRFPSFLPSFKNTHEQTHMSRQTRKTKQKKSPLPQLKSEITIYSYDFSQPEIELRDGPDDEVMEISDPIPCKRRGN